MKKYRSNSESDKSILKVPSIEESGDESVGEYDDGSSHFESTDKPTIGAIVPSTNHPTKAIIATTPTGAIGAAVAILHEEIDPIEEEDDVDIEAIDDDTTVIQQQQQFSIQPQRTPESGSDNAERGIKLKPTGESSLVSKCKKLSLRSKKGKKSQSLTATTRIDAIAPVTTDATGTPSTETASATPAASTSASSSNKSSSNKLGYNNLIASLLRTTTL